MKIRTNGLPELWRDNSWNIRHDFYAKNQMTVPPQPPHFPDLTPSDFSLLLKFKLVLTECRFRKEVRLFFEQTSYLKILVQP